MELQSIIGSQLVNKLNALEDEIDSHLHKISIYTYDKFKGKMLYSNKWGTYNDWIESSLNNLPKLERKFRDTITQIHEKVKFHPEFIPQNTIYCYNGFKSTYKCCPYWGKSPFDGIQNNGICMFTNQYDSDEGMGLVWDQVKTCGVSEGLDE